MRDNPSILLHAPNVHVGGGKVLLDAVVAELSRSGRLKACLLDKRYELPAELQLPQAMRFRNRLLERVKAERTLSNLAKEGDLILCFGNLPPLFSVKGQVKLFLQNRLLVGKAALKGYRATVRLRLILERIWLKLRMSQVNEVIVQSESMKRELEGNWTETVLPQVSIHPFLPQSWIDLHSATANPPSETTFVYIATGDTHKNHRRLIEAWAMLAEQKVFPILQLTLKETQDHDLLQKVAEARAKGARIENLGLISREQIAAVYQKSSALIFPSYSESFGIPLYEALAHKLPIVASELDFVRDVTDPAETFDPFSARSICQAVLRFMGISKPKTPVVSEAEFCKLL